MSAEPAALRRLLSPKSIALVGVSQKGGASRNLLSVLTEHRYPGDLFLVNPRADEIEGLRCYSSVEDLPYAPDVALVVVPAGDVPTVVGACGRAGTGAAVVFSAGFVDDRGPEGQRLQAELTDAVSSTGIRLVGPNCLGFLNVHERIAASWSSSLRRPSLLPQLPGMAGDSDGDLLGAAAGTVAVVAQSGGLGFSLFNRGVGRGIRFSHIISAGNELDLEVQDFVEFLLDDPATRVILLYVEGLKDPGRFQTVAARAEALGKHLVVAKVGRSQVAARAALSHTGHLAGDDAAFGAVFDRYGVVRVHDAEEMLDIALVLSTCAKPSGNRAGVVSYSGGNAVWMADACEQHRIDLPTLSPSVQQRLQDALPSFAATANPVDISGASKLSPGEAISIGGDDPDIDALVLIATYSRADAVGADRAALERLRQQGSKPVLLYSYTEPTPEADALLQQIGIPSFTSTMSCARALEALVAVGTHRPEPPLDPWPQAAAGRSEARGWNGSAPTICEYEVKRLLGKAGVRITSEALTSSATEAVAAAERIG